MLEEVESLNREWEGTGRPHLAIGVGVGSVPCAPLALTAFLRAAGRRLCGRAPPSPGWPEITRINKPWTRWWWPG